VNEPYRANIAVAAYHLDGTRVARWPAGGYGVPAPYLEGLRRAGARTAIIAPGEVGDVDDLLEPYDGLLLCGGGDVDPARYDAEPADDHNYGVEPDRDAFEIDLLRAADRVHKPVLAICRGMQVMNVAFGGTLHQHLPGMPGLLAHGVPLDGTETFHDVAPVPGTLLSATTKAGGALRCSSHHHQGVDRVGDGLVVNGRSPDGLVEAIEREGADLNRDTTWMLGVQWHPEETAAEDLAQQRLFDALVHIARFTGASRRRVSTTELVVAPSDPAWPGRFDQEAARLAALLPEDLVTRIDHVGSTAVPGLDAKPIIDIQVSVRTMTPVEAYVGPLTAGGYRHVLDPWSDDHEFFSRDGDGGNRAVNLHVCADGSDWERKHLAFRDHLRAHPDDAAAYADLKRALAAHHGVDRASYTEDKTDFVERVTAIALRKD
jgi:putative glutamine amidotransferase